MNTVHILLLCLVSSSLPQAISFRYFPRSYLRQGKISVAFYVLGLDPVLIYGILKRKCLTGLTDSSFIVVTRFCKP